MLKNKAGVVLIAVVYVVLFAWLWLHSKNPSLTDVPVLLLAGLAVAVINIFSFGSEKVNKVLMIINLVLLIANIVLYFAVYRYLSGIVKN